MQLLDFCHARAALPVLREAARILSDMIPGFDIKPMPDGTVRLSCDVTPEMIDRLAVWNVASEDFEGDDEREDEGIDEDDDRGPRAAEDLAKHRWRREVRTAAAAALVDLKAGTLPIAPLPAAFAAVFEVREREAA